MTENSSPLRQALFEPEPPFGLRSQDRRQDRGQGRGQDGRYARQEHAFPQERRVRTSVVLFAGSASSQVDRYVAAGAAAMGVEAIGSDYHHYDGSQGYWFSGDLPTLIERVNPAVRYEFLDPQAPGLDVDALLGGCDNGWAVVSLNDPAAAARILAELRPGASGGRAGTAMGVILTYHSPAGCLVCRFPRAAPALEALRAGLHAVPAGPAPGSAELQILTAGLALNEVMVARPGVGAEPRLVGFYSLHRPRRVQMDGRAGLGDLLAELATPPDLVLPSFRGRSVAMVGAGALGNWCAMAMAPEGPHLVIHDGDPEVEASNGNRQILVIPGIGTGRPKAEVLADELRAMDPDGRYESRTAFVEQPAELGSLAGVDAVLCVPDNDEARRVCGDAAWDAGVTAAVGGTSAFGGQAILARPGRACLRCLSGGPVGGQAPPSSGGASCSLVENDAVVGSNAVIAGLLVSELRVALGGGRTANVRFVGDGPEGNRLVRTIADPKCDHVAGARAAETAKAAR